MKYRTFVSAVILMCGLSACQLFAQAAAESVLTHGLSSTAGSSLGKTLGNAIGNAASQLGGRLGQQTATVPKVQRVPAAKTKTASVLATTAGETASSSGSLIASIQGGATSSPATNCAATPKPAQADTSQSKAPAAGTPAAVPTTTCQAAQDADSHPSVLNLPAAN